MKIMVCFFWIYDLGIKVFDYDKDKVILLRNFM